MQWSHKDDVLLIPFQDGSLKGWHVTRRFGEEQPKAEGILNVQLKQPVVSMDFIDDGCGFGYGDF